MATRDEGYTLVELVVVMGIFAIVMTLISVSFSRIVASSGQIIKSAETDIGGLIGLELLRVDLSLAGFGLPWSLGIANYSGEAALHTIPGSAETNAKSFNDSSADGPPRAFAMLNDQGFNGSDYLVLKGSALGMTGTSRGWSYLNYSSKGAVIKQAKSDVELVPGQGDRVIVINSAVRGGVPVRELVAKDNSNFSLSFDPKDTQFNDFVPLTSQDRYLVYGISPAPDDKTDPTDKINFPFNRADYYLAPPTNRDKFSASCAPGTGVLYRAVISQKGVFGNPNPLPILDCVADLQVVFMLDTSNNGTLVAQNLEEYCKALKIADPGVDLAQALREQVKEVRVYVLAQQGKKDPGYSYPDTPILVGDRSWSPSDLAAKDWTHYRWKVYSIVVQPKNL